MFYVKNEIIKKYIFDFLVGTIGVIIMAIGEVLFLLPCKISNGGVTGIATIFYYLFNVKMGAVIIFLNIPLFIIGYFRLGKYFLIKSLYCTALLSWVVDFFGDFNITLNISDYMLSAIYGGILSGIGTALIFEVTSSTGGSELLIHIILSFKNNLKVSKLLSIIDSSVVIMNLIAFRQIDIGLYSFIAIYLTSKLVDIIAEGINFSKVVYIISDRYNEISNEILHKLDKGISGLYGKGMYKSEDKVILMCVIKKRDVIKIKELVKKIDNKAFMIIADAVDVYGLGFNK